MERNLVFYFNYLEEDYRENRTRLFSNLCSEMQEISDILVRHWKRDPQRWLDFIKFLKLSQRRP